MRHFLALLALALLAASASAAGSPRDELALGPWRAWLDCPGGELPFGLDIAREDGTLKATIVNGGERIPVPGTTLDGDALFFSIPHYDATIVARVSSQGERLDGEWTKRTGSGWSALPFHAAAGAAPRFEPLEGEGTTAPIDGRWYVNFESDQDNAVCLLKMSEDGLLAGTFMTTTGDYRYLAGSFEADTMRLSCFDGAHAFLFVAKVGAAGALYGDFWSRDSWHDTFSAVRSEGTQLDDPYRQVAWVGGAAELIFPDLEGRSRSLVDPAFAGRARIIQLFGSWCPNCHDETALLVELDAKYRAHGLSILGLAFELSGDFGRDIRQVRALADRHGVEYPLLIAGLANKEKALEALPILTQVKSYPTTIFLHGDGRIAKVHSGWTGPATGEAFERTVDEFTTLIEELLAEDPPTYARDWGFLTANDWWDDTIAMDGGLDLGSTWTFFEGEDGAPSVRVVDEVADSAFTVHDVTLLGGAYQVAGETWVIDRRAGVLRDPLRFGRRLRPERDVRSPALARLNLPPEHEIRLALGHELPLYRREAIYAGLPRALDGAEFPIAHLFDDHDIGVRVAAAYAAGALMDVTLIPKLLGATKSPNASLRREAARSLGRFPAIEVVELRLTELTADPDPVVRRIARRSLGWR